MDKTLLHSHKFISKVTDRHIFLKELLLYSRYFSTYTFKYCLVFLVCSKCFATCKTHLKRVFEEGVKRQMEERQRSRHMKAGGPSRVGSLVKVQITRAAEVKEEEDGEGVVRRNGRRVVKESYV